MYSLECLHSILLLVLHIAINLVCCPEIQNILYMNPWVCRWFTVSSGWSSNFKIAIARQYCIALLLKMFLFHWSKIKGDFSIIVAAVVFNVFLGILVSQLLLTKLLIDKCPSWEKCTYLKILHINGDHDLLKVLSSEFLH